MFKNNKNKGFSIIELIVAITLSSILIISIAIMLYSALSDWRRNNAAVNLQRDATFAMDMIARAIRPATEADIEVPDPSPGRHPAPSMRVDVTSFYLENGSLFYDPGAPSPNDDVEIARDVTALSFTENDSLHYVDINMVLQNEAESVTLNTRIGYRN